jgi:hypothetical protein
MPTLHALGAGAGAGGRVSSVGRGPFAYTCRYVYVCENTTQTRTHVGGVGERACGAQVAL